MIDDPGAWGRLVAVAIPAGALISLMIYIKSVAAGQSAKQICGVLAALWAALLGTVGVMIVHHNMVGGPLIELDTARLSVRTGNLGAFGLTALLVSLIVVVGLWALVIWQIRRIPSPNQEPERPEAGQEDCDNAVD